MKKKIVIVAVIIALLIGGYIVYKKFFSASLPTGSKQELTAKLKELEYKLLLDKKAGKDTSALEKEIASYQLASEKSSYEGSVYVR